MGKHNFFLKYKILCLKNLYNEVKMHDMLNIVKNNSLIFIQLHYKRSW